MKDQTRKEVSIATYYKENTIRIQPDDILSITVNIIGSSSDAQKIAYDYNLPLQPVITADNSSEINTGMGKQSYLVDKEGKIDFPVLGMIRVSGYTTAELQKYLKKLMLSRHLKIDPVVTVRLMNFKLTITGEVNRPGEIVVLKDHISLLEALAMAGDMTIYGKRDEILLLREMPDGSIKRIILDISKTDIISSPYYYLHQNDVVYVTPNKARSYVADTNPQIGTILGIGSFLISLVSFVMLIKR
ncbi:MAG: polysaccharide biosynthesis/export family protein [Bacteroidales bacterium]|jgi:polysaccharide export outer membrane protein|nr:polysaccharide biosynthesis/export family protein [Bacteroidales bacterium]